jgi:hypothetical protein
LGSKAGDRQDDSDGGVGQPRRILDDRLVVDRVGKRLADARIAEQGIARVQADNW